MSNIEEYTKNFKFIIPEFNVATWHTEIKENFKAIDALIANFVQSQQYQGAWKQVTQYYVGDLVYISDENSNNYGGLFKVLVDHITTSDDFDTFLGNNPTYYDLQGEMGAQVAALRAQDWAEKTDGIVIINESPVDYSSKAYAIGGTGTETNNSKYFKEQAELARDTILEDPGFIAIKNDMLGDENIKTVADNILNVNSIGDNILSILSVYNNLSDINVCVTNINAIIDAPTQATNAQNSAVSAAQSAQTAVQAALSITGFDLFDHKWEDHLLNDQNWLRADTFSWQDGTVYSEAYNHLVADYNGGTKLYGWGDSMYWVGTTSSTPSVGDSVYAGVPSAVVGTVESVGSGSITVGGTTYSRYSDVDGGFFDQVGSYSIRYVKAQDGHKITTSETKVANIYAESGVAWYYVLDTTNQRFKLPRENPAREELIQVVRAKGNDMTESTSVYKGNKYLYFYVGQFSQSATEQTAGLNAELFNGKMDRDMSNMNASQTAKETIVDWGMPDYSAGVSKSWNTDNTAESSGIVIANDSARLSTYIQAVVNSNTLPFYEIASAGQLSISFPVCKGDVWKVYGGDNYGRNLMFYPMKGSSNA